MWKIENLLPVSTETRYFVMLIEILPVLLHLNTSLDFYTPFFIGGFAYFWVFQVSHGT